MAETRLFLVVLLGALLISAMVPASMAGATTRIEELHARSAGSKLTKLRVDVVALRDLARSHIALVGVTAAVRSFMRAPWRREANGLHIWGITMSGVSWFDAGHPELVGMDIASFTDIEGRVFARLARSSADGSGRKVFQLVFPHPLTGRSAKGLHSCFFLKDGNRILCAGGFEDERD